MLVVREAEEAIFAWQWPIRTATGHWCGFGMESWQECMHSQVAISIAEWKLCTDV